MKPPSVHLVGTGVVGRAIIKAHIDAGIGVTVSDQDAASLTAAVDALKLSPSHWDRSEIVAPQGWLPSVSIRHLGRHAGGDPGAGNSDAGNSGAGTSDAHAGDAGRTDAGECDAPLLVIESISEQLDAKRSFFLLAEKYFGDMAVLCSNTSTLCIAAIAEPMNNRNRLCGMHFFMPVDQRPAVELVRSELTSEATMHHATRHVGRLGKQPLVVRDFPGFIVNRLLSPYLNEAMLLLGRGVSAERIEHASQRYGMPLSPLELIDWIGARTMFQAGRVFWQAFPNRISPSPILPGLIKAKRFGRATGNGFYDYTDEVRSPGLSPDAQRLVENYSRPSAPLSDDDVLQILAIPMWIEAAIAMRQGVADSFDAFELAMHGGLGFDATRSWFDFFDSLDRTAMADAITRWSSVTASMNAPAELLQHLKRLSPIGALRAYANVSG
tara:strand:+ start:111746 stop:113062 length:1317 start_codon:yes stop_codon:yes gene_type:complete